MAGMDDGNGESNEAGMICIPKRISLQESYIII